MKHDQTRGPPGPPHGTREAALLAESLERAASLEAACETFRQERDAAVAAAARGQERLARHRLVRAALCLSVATSGALLMRVSTLPPPVRAPSVLARRAVARPEPAPDPHPEPVPVLAPAAPVEEDAVWVGRIGPGHPPERVRAMPVVQRPEP